MSHEDETFDRRYREFVELLPLTTAVAGLSMNPGPRSYTSEQMEARAQVLMSAYKVARQSVRETLKPE